MKNKIAVVLAAGKSSRFFPYNTNHKSAIYILGKPIIVHTLLSLKKSGIEKVILIVSKNSIIKDLVNKEKIDLDIKFIEQEEASGMGEAVLLANLDIKEDFFLLHGHHFDFDQFYSDLVSKKGDSDGVLLAKSDRNSSRYGILKVEKDKVLDLVEKPQENAEKVTLRVIGIYLLNKEFLTILKNTPSEHYHFEKALSKFAKERNVKVVVTDKSTVTLKYPWELLHVKDILLKNIKPFISKKAKIAKGAQIIDNVYISDNVTILEGACIKGPAFIAEDVYIGSNALIRESSDIEKNVTIGGFMEVKNSLIQEGVTTHSGFIGDSVIGKESKIAANFCTGNLRLDRKPVKVEVKNEKIDSGLNFLGVLMGNNVKLGIAISTMPGIIIGNNSLIGPSTMVSKNIQDNTKYYTKFHEIVEEKTDQKKLILFDIDNTIFNTTQYRVYLHEEIAKILKKHGRDHSRQEFDDLVNQLLERYGLFDPEDFIKHFASDLGEEAQKVIRDVFYSSGEMKKFLYNEVALEIAKFANLGEVGILSQGVEKFQVGKLSAIASHFHPDRIHVARDKREDMKNLFKKYSNYQIFFIDDLLIMLEGAKNLDKKVTTVLMKRGAHDLNKDSKYSPDFEAENLTQVFDFIKNY